MRAGKEDTQVFRTFAVGNNAKYPNASGPRIEMSTTEELHEIQGLLLFGIQLRIHPFNS